MTPQARGLATRERVLDAALRVFVERGLADATIQELSELSRTSVGSLYHHFGDRAGVVTAVYERSLGAMLAHISAAVVDLDDPGEGVRTMVRAYLEFVGEHPDEARFVYAASAHVRQVPGTGPGVAAASVDLVQPLVRWVEAHVRAGRIRPLPPPLLEVAIIGPAAEAARRILDGAPGLSLVEAAAVLPELAWRSVAVEPDEVGRSAVAAAGDQAADATAVPSSGRTDAAAVPPSGSADAAAVPPSGSADAHAAHASRPA